jgi:hypothetical protein
MKYVNARGDVEKELTWRCGGCRNDIRPNLLVIEGGTPFPFDLPINCPQCLRLVGLFNPSAAEEVTENEVAREDAGSTAR